MRIHRSVPIVLALLMLTTSVPVVLGQSADPTAHTDPVTAASAATGQPHRQTTGVIGIVTTDPQARQEYPPMMGVGHQDTPEFPAAKADCLPNWYSESHNGALPTSRCAGGQAQIPQRGNYQRLWSYPDKYYCGSGFPVGGVDPSNATQTAGPIGYYSMDAIIADPLMVPLTYGQVGPVSLTNTQFTQGAVGIDDNFLHYASNHPNDAAGWAQNWTTANTIGSTKDPGYRENPDANASYAYEGGQLELASWNLSQTRLPVTESYVVLVYCEVPDANSPTGFDSHPTEVLPQNFTYQIDPSTGQYHKVWSDASRGIFGYYDHASSSGGNPAVKASEFFFFGDCSDGSVIWTQDHLNPDAPRSCDKGGNAYGEQVLTSGWYWGNQWLGQAQTPVETLYGYAVNRFELNPTLVSVFPQLYNSVFADAQAKCALNGGSGEFHVCGKHPIYLQRGHFPSQAQSAYSILEPAPVAEDIEIIGNGTQGKTVSPVVAEAYGDTYATEMCFRPAFSNYCPITGSGSIGPMARAELEPNHPNDTQEQSVLTQTGAFATSPVLTPYKPGWTLSLDVQKVTLAMPEGHLASDPATAFDPVYGLSGQNDTQSCTYSDQSGTPAPDPATGTNPCNRRDVWPTGFTLVANFGFMDANGQYVDNQVDTRLKQEWLGLPDMTTLGKGNNSHPYNLADVGSANGGNDVSFDIPGGYVIQVDRACTNNPDANASAINGSSPTSTNPNDVVVFDPNKPLTGSVGVGNPSDPLYGDNYTVEGWASTPQDTHLVSTSYATPEPASNPDVKACNRFGDPATGWGTFVGGKVNQTADWFGSGNLAGHYASNVEYIVPSGAVGLVRTHVTAQIHVPNTSEGLNVFSNLFENPMASTLQPGHTYTLSDVDYYGTGTLGN